VRKNKLQFGVMLAASAAYLMLPATGWAQQPHADRPPQHQAAPPHVSQPPQQQPQNQNANRPPANPNRPGSNANAGNNRPETMQNERQQGNLNNENRPRNGQSAGLSTRQPMGTGGPRPWVDQMRSLTPRQREQVLQNSKTFQGLSPDKQNKIRQQFNQWDRMTPQQRADQQIKENNWRRLSPEQQQHIKNDVWPKWKQMPWDRQQVMKQKLGVLQNMPESARNQRLNDPNFTRGMSDEEKSVLHDLAHTHVGGAPEPPGE
jgi:hypothetical protein